MTNKTNRGGDGIFRLKHPSLDSKFIMSQKPFDVLIAALGKELTPVLQITVLTFDAQHYSFTSELGLSLQ